MDPPEMAPDIFTSESEAEDSDSGAAYAGAGASDGAPTRVGRPSALGYRGPALASKGPRWSKSAAVFARSQHGAAYDDDDGDDASSDASEESEGTREAAATEMARRLAAARMVCHCACACCITVACEHPLADQRSR